MNRWGALWLLALASAAHAQGQGYQLVGNQVVVNAQGHWQNWRYAPGTLELTSQGEVRARQWRKNINAVEGIVDFLRLNPPVALGSKKPEEISLEDALQAGSNPGQVAALLDGDLGTFWEPGPLPAGADLATQWWLVVDLGRVVFANKLVLRFVEEELGDPFLLFDVLVSDGTRPARVRGAASPEYRSVLQTLQRNKTQRTFEIDLRRLDPVVAGEGLRFVQLVVTGSDFDRGREVSRLEYEALPLAQRGAVEYHKRLSSGQEVVVSEAVHQQLAVQRQGSIRYFRRERPRLAELEVWAEGDELLVGTLERGGSLALPGGEDVNLRSFIDGDLVTDSNLIIGKNLQVAEPERSLIFDLGSTFWVDSQRMAYGRGLYRGSMADYRLDFSDGTLAADGSIKWTRVVNRQQTQQNGARFDGNEFSPLKARFFRLQYTLTSTGHQTANLAEIQLYGQGYQPRVELESELIRLGGSRNLLGIEWEADTPPGTQVLIQTRTGDDLQEELHYFKKDGTEVSEEQYKKLLSIFKGEIVSVEVEGSGWSDWSEPYTDPAAAITSPSPREFLKLRAVLLSDDPQTTATLRQVRLHFADPVAQGLVGELDPVQLPRLGERRVFSLYLKPDFASTDRGFDQLLLRVPPDMELEFEGVYAGRAIDFEAADLAHLSLDGVAQISSHADSLHLSFPAIGPQSGIELLRVDFGSTLFSTGAVVEAALQRSGAGGASQWQRIDAGNAFAGSGSNSLTLVGVAQHKEVLVGLEVESPLFTPNGDGVNDQAAIDFSVVLLGDTSPAVVEIRDLGGRLVRRLESAGGPVGTGQRRVLWDGRDLQGKLAPAGIYLARLSLAADTQGAGVSRSSLLRHLALVY